MSDDSGMTIRAARRVVLRLVDRAVLRPGACAARLWRDTRAITSLEWALVGFPFFFLTMGTISLGIWHFYTTCLDIAVYKSARQVMTGQFQRQAIATPQAFSTQILCPNMPGQVGTKSIVPCSSTNPVISMAVVNDFTTLFTPYTYTPPGCFSSSCKITSYTLNSLQNVICSPQQGSMVYIQAQYRMPNLFGWFLPSLAVVTSGATIKVEEFPNGSGQLTNCAGVTTATPCCPA